MSTVFGPAFASARPAASVPAWETQLQAIEEQLNQLDSAFAHGDPQLVAACAQALHDTLTRAMVMLRAGQGTALPVDVIRRLSMAQARARAHQQAVTRGRIAAERALSVLIERDDRDSTYASLGPGLAGRVTSAYR